MFDTKIFVKEKVNSNKPNIPIYEKYISANYKYCGGLGNQLFHFAIYYGIGRALNRTALFYANKDCEVNAKNEIKYIFPNSYPYIKLLTPTKNETKFVNNMEDCCNYENLTKTDDKYLIFKDHVRHFYKFFNNYDKDIRYFMEFNMELRKNVTFIAHNLFGNDTSHKFCIHIRRGDFLSPYYKYQESREEFIVPATNYIHKYLTKEGYSNISLILMGADDKFKHSLSINSSLFHHIYYPLITSRNEDLAFGALNCDTFLISATASSFAFWIAYLMPEGNMVFYNGNLYKKEKSNKFPFALNFPSHWNKLDYS
uniref:Alpha-1,2-fucosyltransferase n=1 Tax=Panagrolaimus sp. PS1159 TaxID=55785 RepID=A0AC35FGB0_9BILA